MSRQERRKARTRQALLDAAIRLTADGRADAATILEVTEEADLGFGTFYNYFESKEQLFEEASATVLEEWGVALDDAARHLSDPAEAFALKFRLSGRAGRTHPDRARFLTELGMRALLRPDGLAPRARRDLDAAFASGRLRHPCPDVALAAVAGALLGLLEHQLTDAGDVGDEVVDGVTAGLLRMLGATEADAADLCSRPLPTPAEVSPRT
jgi:AcrR family transcriptional regulator